MGSRRLSSLAALVATLASIAACEAQLDPIVVAMDCPEMPLRRPEEAADNIPIDRLIDDFDDGDYYLAMVAGRDGLWAWATNNSSNRLYAGPSADCAARGTKAGNFSGAGFTKYGASWTGFFKAQTTISPTTTAVYYNLADGGYTGISFWAAIGKGEAPFSLQLGLSTMDTVPNGFPCSTPPLGTIPTSPVCFDYYKTTVELTHTWQRFVIPFSDLANMFPQFPLRPEYAVGFLVWPSQTEFDIWFDDIRFEVEQ